MKKSLLVLCAALIAFSLTAFGFISWNHTEAKREKAVILRNPTFDYGLISIFCKAAPLDLLYKVDHRFRTSVTKETLHKATSILDMLPEEATESIVTYKKVKVAVLHNGRETYGMGASELGTTDRLTPAQVQLLQSTDYSSDILIRADYQTRNPHTGELQNDYLSYYLTIVPEKEAAFPGGYDALIHYLKENSRYFSLIIKKDQLEPGKVSFTVTREGNIADVVLASTSGYSSIDERLVELIRTMPGAWDPATNSRGEKIDQQLVFFFGMEGC